MTLSKFLNLNKRIKVHNYFRDLKMEKYIKNGKDIYDTYCTSTEARPIMLPQAPQHKYIDVYPDESEPGPCFKDDKERQLLKDDKKRQLDYETEVVVYRALEGIDEDINVLHSFEYTHRQYNLCNKSHDRKECMDCRRKKSNNREGECDFLIIGKKSVVIIEVKNITNFSEAKQQEPGLDEQKHKLGLQGSYEKSLKQRQRIVKLIESIEKCTKIFHFTAFPNFTKGSSAELTLEPDQLSSVIFKEDIEDFQSWWKSNITDFHIEEALMSDFQAKHEKVRNMLLAIWCADNKGHCDKSKCSLGWCIQDIDDKLRSGNFTFRKSNPNVIQAPDVIKEYLGVNNLTKKQFEAYNSEEQLVLINGPAGTGKSVILIAKAIQRAKSNANRKILFFIHNTPAEEGVKTAFEKASVRHCTIPWNETHVKTTLQIVEIISDKLADNQVIIIHCPDFKLHGGKMEVMSNSEIIQRYSEILTSHLDCDVFIDDMQSIPCYDDIEVNNIMTTICSSLEGSQSNGYIWIAHDKAQDRSCTIYPLSVQPSNSPFHTITLSKNLRNTYDISNSLSVIRDQIEEEIMREGSPDSNETIVKQTPGHYIRGPKINIHVFKSVDVDLMGTYLCKELDKLQRGNVLTQLNTAVLYRGTTGTTQKTLREMIKIQLAKHRGEPVGNIPLLYSYNTSSGEWPAVIVILGFGDLFNLPSLYLAMSRARVYCTVLLFSNNDTTLEAMEQFLSSDFKHCANIKRHS